MAQVCMRRWEPSSFFVFCSPFQFQIEWVHISTYYLQSYQSITGSNLLRIHSETECQYYHLQSPILGNDTIAIHNSNTLRLITKRIQWRISINCLYCFIRTLYTSLVLHFCQPGSFWPCACKLSCFLVRNTYGRRRALVKCPSYKSQKKWVSQNL